MQKLVAGSPGWCQVGGRDTGGLPGGVRLMLTARAPPLGALLSACLQARWLVGLLQRGPEAAKQAFSIIPESVVRDMTAWLRWVGVCPVGLLGGDPFLS